MCLCGLRFKRHYFPHTVHYCCPLCPTFLKRVHFLQSSLFWEARGALIGQVSSALLIGRIPHSAWWKCDGPYHNVMPLSQRNDTKTIKPITNETFVALQCGHNLLIYNDLIRLLCACVACIIALRKHNTMSTFVIGVMTNNTHLLYKLKTHCP